MKNKFTKEIITAVILVLLLLVIWNPGHVFMTTMVHMMLAGVAVIVFGLFATLILKEKAGDEREEAHRGLAGRIAFLVGSSVLLIGILVQVIQDHIDVWLVVALVAMVIAKVIMRLYGENYK